MADKLNDRWQTRDFPVLLEVARQMDSGAHFVMAQNVARVLDMRLDEVVPAFEALTPYLESSVQYASGGVAYHAVAKRLTERGRRATGLWPDNEAVADALVELLAQAADQVDDEDDAGALRKAGRLLKNVPASIVTDVTMALIRQQTGLP